MTTVVTHNGSFHLDDLFAVAVLSLVLKDIELVRTRDEEVIEDAEYVVDVGSEYDPSRGRFDHHQMSGPGVERENRIPYASFGLVWREYGEELCGSPEVAEEVDRSLVQAIDAGDNGVSLYTPEFEGVFPYTLQKLAFLFQPTWKEDQTSIDAIFQKFLPLAAELILREISVAKDAREGREKVKELYEEADDKRVIILDAVYPWKDVLLSYPEPRFVLYPKRDSGAWNVRAVPLDAASFDLRLSLPESWAGKRDEELQEVSGVSDAVFCHNNRFLAVAGSKEGALALAGKALENA